MQLLMMVILMMMSVWMMSICELECNIATKEERKCERVKMNELVRFWGASMSTNDNLNTYLMHR
jgi:hypothetical protein